MTLTLREVIDSRPARIEGIPFAEVLNHLTNAVTELLEVADVVAENAETFIAEFGELTEEEQNQFGAVLAAGLLTVRSATAEIADAVTDAFEAVDQ